MPTCTKDRGYVCHQRLGVIALLVTVMCHSAKRGNQTSTVCNKVDEFRS